jgi:putative SOS response-associated peptidase YedK
MPVVLTTSTKIETWLNAPVGDALKLQRPLADGALKVVARNQRNDGAAISGKER